MNRSLYLGLLVMISLLALSSAAVRADVFAAVNVAAPPPRTDLDIAIVNASLGTRVALPAGVNTTAFEIHPSVSTDGRRLVFRRFGGSDGQRVILVDVTTAQGADLFTRAELASNTVFNSTITRDGTKVYTGRRFRSQGVGGTLFAPEVSITDLTSFPTGPFPRSQTFFGFDRRFNTSGIVTDVSVDGRYTLMRVLVSGSNLGKLVVSVPEKGLFIRGNTNVDYGQPTLIPGGGAAFFEQRTFSPSSNTFGNSDVMSLETGYIDSTSRSLFETNPPQREHATPADESQPAFTGGVDYEAHVRHEADGHDRLFVYHTATTTLLNPNGVDLGFVATRGIGSVSLYKKTVIASSQVSRGGEVKATLLQPASIGILVQRIHDVSSFDVTKERGRKEYELETVGRVPLGSFRAGKVATQWNLSVNGEPLQPGRYLVTLRAVDGDIVREFGRSRVIRIRR